MTPASRLAWLLLAPGLLIPACSSGQGAADGGPDSDGWQDVDAIDRADHDPGAAFLLTIPSGTSLCSGFSEGRTWRQEAAMVSRIDLLAGARVLPRTEGLSAAPGAIEQILFGPAGELLEPLAAEGDLTAEYHRGPPEEWVFTLTVPFSLGPEPVEVDLVVQLASEAGDWPAEIDITDADQAVTVFAEIRVGEASDWITQVQRYGLCELPEGYRRVTAVGPGGASIDLDVRQGPGYRSCLVDGKTVCLFLVGAEVAVGDHQESIRDRMRLVYNGSHHNWSDSYLLILEAPAGDVHALLAIAPDFMGQRDGEFVYLDAGLDELRRETVPDWTGTFP